MKGKGWRAKRVGVEKRAIDLWQSMLGMRRKGWRWLQRLGKGGRDGGGSDWVKNDISREGWWREIEGGGDDEGNEEVVVVDEGSGWGKAVA
ncbi:hypothetical protein ACH5RR_034019 [Cinchona calisaya]|uniref:Uncharacterized protein n=1 Tax=Cinchona calisaya TaxID=153742 RepID=A0ABD2Y9N2_9GENT